MTRCSCCGCRSRCHRCRRRRHHRSRCHLIRRHHIWATKIAPALMYECYYYCCCWSYVKCFRSNRLFKCFLVFSSIFLLLRLLFLLFVLFALYLPHSLLFSSMLFTPLLLTWQIAIRTHINERIDDEIAYVVNGSTLNWNK